MDGTWRINASSPAAPALWAPSAYQTTVVIVLTWMVVLVAALRAERLDRRRRIERSLADAAVTDRPIQLFNGNRLREFCNSMKSAVLPPGGATISAVLDRFRSFNQVFGQEIGDELVVEAGRRLSSIARQHLIGAPGRVRRR
jgi:hypothetical protein